MARFTLPRDVYFGKGALENLKGLKGKKAIICVGGGSMKRFGFLDRAKAYLEEHQSENLDSLNLNDMAAWLTEHEDAASRYREYHYEKLWNGKNAN